MKHLLLTILLLLLPFVFTGCSNKNPQGRVAVRGEVTFDGKPLEHGDVLFQTIAGTSPMVATGSPIKDGKFSLPKEKGLIPDQTYSVQFRSVEEIPDAQKIPGRGSLQTRNILPRKYGVDSKETVTATKKSPNVFQFDLTSGK